MLTISRPLQTVMDFSAIFSPCRRKVEEILGFCKENICKINHNCKGRGGKVRNKQYFATNYIINVRILYSCIKMKAFVLCVAIQIVAETNAFDWLFDQG